MLNLNGQLLLENEFNLNSNNRAFKYGDAIFETINILNGKIIFWEDHYFRLMASMRMLRMEIPMNFTLEFLEEQILKTIASKSSPKLRVRLTVYRKDGGLYSPITNAVNFLIEASENTSQIKKEYKIDLYKDFYNYSGLLSTIKTTNRILNTLASIYMDENELDNCVLLNENKGVVEVTNANIFIVNGNEIKTPALEEGCIKGIARKKVIEMLKKHEHFTIKETNISPFEIQKANEVFITNSIVGVQPVTNYKKKKFMTQIGEKIAASFKLLQITGR